MNSRVKWIDTAKCLGIFAIYLGHFTESAGSAYHYVFTFHVPLFFLISGCVESFHTEIPLGKYIIKKIKTILLPFFFFVLISIFIYTIQNNIGLREIAHYLKLGIVFGAVRNSFLAYPLWFLSCLFVMEIFFGVLRKFLNKYLIFLLCILLYYCPMAGIFTFSIPYYNVNSVIGYSIYYAIGFIVFPYIQKCFVLETKAQKWFFGISGIAAFCYSALLFKKHDLLSFCAQIPVLGRFTPVFRALITIWLVFVVSRLLENIVLLNKLGSNSLYLCGSEYIIKAVVPAFVSVFGWSIQLLNPLSTYLYTAFLLVLVNTYIVPIEKKCIKALQSIFFKNLFKL